MARKISDIFDTIALTKAGMSDLDGLLVDATDGTSTLDTSQKLLTDLKSSSKVSIWRLWIWVTAVAIWAHENLWDIFRVEIVDLINHKDIGSLNWYQSICFEYQHGDALSWNGKRFIYAVIDATKKIIAKAAATEEGGVVRLKVAKLSGSDIIPLTGPELTAFTAYMRLRKFAGTFLTILSVAADMVCITGTVIYDATLLDDTGQSLANPGEYPVEDAINGYVAELNQDFNGKFFNSELVMVIKQVESVVDVPTVAVKTKNELDGTYVTVNASIVAYSGHFAIDPTYPLRTQLTYVPNV